MTTKQFTRLLTIVVIAAAGTSTANAQQETFRGIPTPTQGNQFGSPASFLPYFYDLTDDFARTGNLGDSVVDGFRIGYVPPYEFDPITGEPVPNGPLTGNAADLNGRWMPQNGTDYITSSDDGGFVSRAPGSTGVAVACLNWRVHPLLGKRYLIEMSAEVAMNETVTLGYFGDVATLGAAQGLAGELGQLVLGITRTSADEVSWTVAWDDHGSRVELPGGTIDASLEEEIRLQLAWDDIRNSDNDLFDAWLETSSGNQRLLSGNMNTAIDVFGAGFELNGTGSRIFDFVTAVPEPTSMLTTLCGLLWLVGNFRRRR